MSKLKDLWKQRAENRVYDKEFKSTSLGTYLKAVNIFNAVGDELDAVGDLLHLPRLEGRSPGDQRCYRMRLISRCLVQIGTYAHPSSDLELNAAAVALGTFQNDPEHNHPEDYESRAGLEDRLKEIAMDWLVTHGDIAHHVCEECTK